MKEFLFVCHRAGSQSLSGCLLAGQQSETIFLFGGLRGREMEDEWPMTTEERTDEDELGMKSNWLQAKVLADH